MSEEEFLSRWSRRKRTVAADKPQAEAASEVEAVPEPETPEEEEALLAKLNLPKPESLTEGDDFSVFMAKSVPEFLRKRALRTLWKSNPVLANLDGLNDYDEDFTSPELTQKVLATGYKVGRGFVSQIVEDAKDDAPTAPESVADEPDEDEPEAIVLASENPPDPIAVEAEELDEMPLRPRRMRFDI